MTANESANTGTGPAGVWRRLYATARLTFRAAACSKVLICLAGLLVLTVVALPLIVKGDGTLYGRVQILLRYTLGFAAGIMAVMTVWTSCGSVSHEIAERHIQLVMVKPVRPIELWTGKWLGILCVNALLLLLSGAAVYLQVQRVLAEPGVTAEERVRLRREILVARRRRAPRPPETREQVRQHVERMRAAGRWPAGMDDAEAFATAGRQLRMRRNAVGAGESRTWHFDLPASFDPGAPITLRFRCTASAFSAGGIRGSWQVGTRDRPGLFQVPLTAALGRWDQLQIPSSAVPAGAPLLVTFRNGSSDGATTVLFDHTQEPELLYNATSFEGNLLRALLVLLGFQALLSALGLTAGSLFSSAVATFSAGGAIVVFLMVHAFAPSGALREEAAGPGPEIPAFVEATNAFIVRTLGTVVEPVMRIKALEPLSDGLRVSWATTGQAILLLMAVYPGVLAVCSAFLLRRRELGNPGIS